MADLKIERLPISVEPASWNQRGNRRRQPRHPLVVQLTVPLSVPPDEARESEVSDVSPGGAALITRNKVSPGTIVMFTCAGQRIYGIVGYCHGCPTGYRVGVRITEAIDEPEPAANS